MDELILDTDLLAEPYRIKVIEKVHLPDRQAREVALKAAGYSMVYLPANQVYIDLVTDSGSGAMSDMQWSALMRGDESYIHSQSYDHFVDSVSDTINLKEIIPTHQGRAAENILMQLLVKEGCYIPCNTFFETTRAHIEMRGATPLDLIGDELWSFQSSQPFKGNFDIKQLEVALEKHQDKIPFILVTIVNNIACCSPVSMENLRDTYKLAKKYNKLVIYDACRFAENAYLIKTREQGYQDHSIKDIIHEMTSYCDICYVSAKKDAITNTGGFIATNLEEIASACREMLMVMEGFPTYGGLTGRDMEAIAIGLREGIDEAYLKSRIAQSEYLAKQLAKHAGLTVSQPSGSSGVFIDINSIYPHLKDEQLPGVTLGANTYLEGGVRLGAFPFQLRRIDTNSGDIKTKPFSFVRLAIPRRVYTKGHLDYVTKVLTRVKEKATQQKGFKMTYAPERMTHIFAKYEPL